tara:strand:- start:83 stop:3013 length:2931 start_codon:yes stop_codon:yes gene_type:complete
MNARNNFLSTAEKQESVYKLAEFLGYQPRRNVPAYGEMKIVSVKTNEPIIGSTGESLGGTEIKYEVSNNVNNLDDFITIINSVLQNSNKFGSPKKSVVINNITTEFYDFNNTADQIKFDVQGAVSGKQSTFNIINSDYDNVTRSFTEKSPNPAGSFGIYFKNDGKGINSVNTGFFFGVKQGSLQYEDIQIVTPIDNASFDIENINVNNSDVWVQNINSTGTIVKEWTKVRDVNSNVIYNNLAHGERNVFSVKTRTDNKISVVFPDRVFGNIPKDTIRVWFRTSANSTYILRPDDLTSKKIQINYTSLDGNNYTAVFNIQLKQSISTASSNETINEIKENAPKNYASQDRMITAQDYNTMLGNTNGGIVKIKSINRTFSGHSRYSKFNDTTGTYSNLYLQGADATIYAQDKLVATSAAASDGADLIYEKYTKDILNNDEFVNLYYNKFRQSFYTLAGPNATGGHDHIDSIDPDSYNVLASSTYTWITDSNSASGIFNGHLIDPTTSNITRVGTTVSNYMQYITPGAIIKFKKPDGTFKWAKVVDVHGHGLGIEGTGNNAGKPTGLRADGTGAIILDAGIETASTIEIIYPALSKKFSIRERALFISYFKAKRSFTIKYDYKTRTWNINATPDVFDASLPFAFDFDSTDPSWVVYFNYTGTSYDIYLRTLRINFRSSTVNLGNIQNEVTLGTYTKKAKRDIISILGANSSTPPEFESKGSLYVYGYDNADSVDYRLSLIDGNADSRPENPDAFTDIVGTTTITVDTVSGISGNDNRNFQWEHIAADNQVVDPSFTNIIDVFALSKSYDTEYKNYLKGTVTKEPLPPTSYQLGSQFSSIIDKKAVSDTIVYKPVKYRPMFGSHADAHLRARFRIIKLFGSNVTDTDLKSKTVEAIDSFFESSNWDFGETFYFTELAAYVHKQLAGILSSFVIVPQGAGSVFGDMFEYTPHTDELIISDVDVNDIDIITSITDANIKAGT